jgi:hypothetical protein
MMAKRYIKKPVVIEAFQFGYEVAPSWFTDRIVNGSVVIYDKTSPIRAEIETLEGWHMANCGDYIIRGVKGEIYPCKSDIFELTYEAVKGE